MPWIMDAQSWKIIWGQSLMSRWVANHANSLRFPVPWKQACVLCFWFSFFWPCFPDLPSASGWRGHMMRRISIMLGWFWSSIRSPELLYSWQYDTGHNFCKRPFFSSTVIQRTSSLSTEKDILFVWSKPLSDVFISVFTGGKIMLHAEFFFDETVDCRDGFRRRFFRRKREIQGKGDIFIGTHLIPPVYQCRMRCEWLVWPVHRWTFAKQSHIS